MSIFLSYRHIIASKNREVKRGIRFIQRLKPLVFSDVLDNCAKGAVAINVWQDENTTRVRAIPVYGTGALPLVNLIVWALLKGGLLDFGNLKCEATLPASEAFGFLHLLPSFQAGIINP